jgi:hypothetical protein
MLKKTKVSKNKNIRGKCLKHGKNTFIWIFLLFVGFMGNDVYDVITAETSLDIIMPDGPNEKGEFEITLVNNGDIDLEIEKVKIHSCNMDENTWVYRYPDNIPNGERLPVYFYDEKTLSNFKLINCRDNPLEDWQNKRGLAFPLCVNKDTGEFVVPNYEQTIFICGICYWTIEVETPDKTFNFYEAMGAPIELTQEIYDESNLSINDSRLMCNDSIKITPFGMRELEIEGEYDL